MELSIDFMTVESLKKATQDERVSMIINKVKDKKIIVFNARFDPRDEAALIKKTMEHVNKQFPGIEICSLSYEDLVKKHKGKPKNETVINQLKEQIVKLKFQLINLLTGGKAGMTVIGPAKIVKEIKREPDRIRLLTK